MRKRASWCQPCLMQMPNIKQAAQLFADDLVVCLVSIDKSGKKLRDFLVRSAYPHFHKTVGWTEYLCASLILKGQELFLQQGTNGVLY